MDELTNLNKHSSSRSPFMDYLGIKIERIVEGRVYCKMNIEENYKNANDVVHGGVYFTLLDTVMGATIKLTTNKSAVTINSTIHYFAPLVEGNQLFAYAKIIKCGKSIVIVEGEAKDCNGNLLAKTTGTFKFV